MAVTLFPNSLGHQLIILWFLVNEITSYEKILLEESRLCTLKPHDETSIYLGKGESSSKIVMEKTYFDNWTGKYNFKCSFSVLAPAGYGLYAVIQVLNFRRDEDTGRCRDYVLMKIPQNIIERIFNPEKSYFCGRIYSAQTYSSHANDSRGRHVASKVSDNGFVAREGRMHVTISVAPERLVKYEKLEVQIAFTSFKKNCKSNEKNSVLCRPCEWIWDGLVDDNVQNCPYTSCADENQCKNLDSPFETHIVINKDTGTKATVIAISAITIVFFLFTICLCICRRSRWCCWQAPANNSVRMEMNRARSPYATTTTTTTPDDVVVATSNELRSDAFSPSAPALPDTKDEPPSYESLFPSK